MPIITINRIREFENRFRKIRIEIDGKLAGKIKNGEKKQFTVSHGKHYIQAKIDWCTSNILEINSTQEVNIELCKGEGSVLYRTISGYKEYLKLMQV